MAKSLLRSGNLDDYQAVGGGGQAVFESALQIRETLRLRKQQAMVDCLAIPQLNDNGDRVDWYSPIEGQAIAWKAADEETRSRALRYLASTIDAKNCQYAGFIAIRADHHRYWMLFRRKEGFQHRMRQHDVAGNRRRRNFKRRVQRPKRLCR